MESRISADEPSHEVLNNLEYSLKKLQTIEKFRSQFHLGAEEKMILLIFAIQKLKQEKNEDEYLFDKFKARDIDIRTYNEREVPWVFKKGITLKTLEIFTTDSALYKIKKNLSQDGFVPFLKADIERYYPLIIDLMSETLISMLYMDLWSNIQEAQKALNKHLVCPDDEGKCREIISIIFGECVKFDDMELQKELKAQSKFAINRTEIVRKFILDRRDDIARFESPDVVHLDSLNLSAVDLSSTSSSMDLSDVAITRCNLRRTILTGTAVTADHLKDNYNFSEAKGVDPAIILEAVNYRLNRLDEKLQAGTETIDRHLSLLKSMDLLGHFARKEISTFVNDATEEQLKGVVYCLLARDVKEIAWESFDADHEFVINFLKDAKSKSQFNINKTDIVALKLHLFRKQEETIQEIFRHLLIDIKYEQKINPTEDANYERQTQLLKSWREINALLNTFEVKYTQQYINALLKSVHECNDEDHERHHAILENALNLCLQSPLLTFSPSKKVEAIILGQDALNALFQDKRRQQRKYLIHAVINNDAPLLRKLLSEDMDFNFTVSYKDRNTSLLEIAFENNNPVIAKILLSTYGNGGTTLNDDLVQQLLTIANQKQNYELVMLLQLFGITLDPIWAIKFNQVEPLKALAPLEEDASEERFRERKKLLDTAVNCHAKDAMHYLWELDKKPELLDIKSAIYLGKFSLVMNLFSRNKLYADDEGNTPIMLLIYRYNKLNGVDCLDLINRLIDRQIDLEAKNKKSKTALAIACENNLYDVAQTLIDNNANVNPIHSQPPLLCAIKLNSVSCVELLLANQANPDVSWHGKNALHLAAKLGHIESLELLLNHGAKVLTKDAKGRTPIDLATDINVIILLRKYSSQKSDKRQELPFEFSRSRLSIFSTDHLLSYNDDSIQSDLSFLVKCMNILEKYGFKSDYFKRWTGPFLDEHMQTLVYLVKDKSMSPQRAIAEINGADLDLLTHINPALSRHENTYNS